MYVNKDDFNTINRVARQEGYDSSRIRIVDFNGARQFYVKGLVIKSLDGLKEMILDAEGYPIAYSDDWDIQGNKSYTENKRAEYENLSIEERVKKALEDPNSWEEIRPKP